MSENTKEEKVWAVSRAVLEIIEKEGLMGVTHSKIARKSNVSRPWIYEYLGKEKAEIVNFAAKELARHFARIDLGELPKNPTELKSRTEDGLAFLLQSVSKTPVAIKLFYKYRGTSNPLGEVIQEYETKWLETASKTLLEIYGISKEQAIRITEFVLTLRLGYAHRILTSEKPKESEARATETFKFLDGLLGEILGEEKTQMEGTRKS